MARMPSLGLRTTSAPGSGPASAEGGEAEGIGGGELGAPIVDGGSEADDFGGDVVDEAGAFGVDGVEGFQEVFGVVAEMLGLVEVGAAASDEFHGGGLHHFVRYDVDVKVDDGSHWR